MTPGRQPIGPACESCGHRSVDHGDGFQHEPACFRCPCAAYVNGGPSPEAIEWLRRQDPELAARVSAIAGGPPLESEWGDGLSVWVPADPREQTVYVGVHDVDNETTSTASLSVDEALEFAGELERAAKSKQEQIA